MLQLFFVNSDHCTIFRDLHEKLQLHCWQILKVLNGRGGHD